MVRSNSRTSGVRILSGWWTLSPRATAACFTEGAANFCPRPLGRSGCVKTAAIWWLAARSCNDGTANSGVPMKTSFMAHSFPLASLDHALDAPLDHVAAQHAQVGNEQAAVQMIGLMAERARQQVL